MFGTKHPKPQYAKDRKMNGKDLYDEFMKKRR